MEYKLDKIAIQISSKNAIKIPTSLVFDMEKEGYFLKDEYTSTKMMGYLYNYVFKRDIAYSSDKETIYIGISRNTYKDCSQGLLYSCIEYNPQKTKIPDCLRWFFTVNGCKYDQVNRCDIAIDFDGLKPEDCYLATRHKIMIVGTCDNLTRYIRPTASHLRIKIYDKKKERILYGEEISQRLRVEISLKHPIFHETDYDKGTMLYLSEVKNALAEVSLVTDMDRDHLVKKYGKYNESILYLLSLADATTIEGALSKMGATSRAKYRAWLKDVANKPIDIDMFHLYKFVGDQLRKAIENCLSSVKYLNQY